MFINSSYIGVNHADKLSLSSFCLDPIQIDELFEKAEKVSTDIERCDYVLDLVDIDNNVIDSALLTEEAFKELYCCHLYDKKCV